MKFVAGTADAGAGTLIADHGILGPADAILPFVTKAARSGSRYLRRSFAGHKGCDRKSRRELISLAQHNSWAMPLAGSVFSKGHPRSTGHFIVIRFTIARTGWAVCSPACAPRVRNLWNSLTWPRRAYGNSCPGESRSRNLRSPSLPANKRNRNVRCTVHEEKIGRLYYRDRGERGNSEQLALDNTG